MDTDILSRIERQRRVDVAAAETTTSVAKLHERVIALFSAPPIDVVELLVNRASGLAIAAEFKRASPSKGALVAADTPCAPSVGAYTRGGASIISVLTEPTWFCGSLADLEAARSAAEACALASGCPRPAILRKDFILTNYQVLEARAYGADTLLLIVSSLPTVALLLPLIDAARALGMEPLVEVNSPAETVVALDAGARLLGINNRNLRTFVMDLSTTARVVATAAVECRRRGVPYPAIMSLSGLRDSADIPTLVADCTAAVADAVADYAETACDAEAVARALLRGALIGEAFMRAGDAESAVRTFVEAGRTAYGHASPLPGDRSTAPLLAKICGVRTSEDALHAAANAGCSFIGIICVPGSPRCVGAAASRDVVLAIQRYRERGQAAALLQQITPAAVLSLLPERTELSCLRGLRARMQSLRSAAARARPLTVGVFMDQSPDAVLEIATAVGLDVVQLHGAEDPASFSQFPLPIIKVLHVPVPGGGGSASTCPPRQAELGSIAETLLAWSHVASMFLLDSKAQGGGSAGGTGLSFDVAATLPALADELTSLLAPTAGEAGEDVQVPLLIAGGLTPSSVPLVVQQLREAAAAAVSRPRHGCIVRCVPVGLDVSSGVEYDAGAAPVGREGKGFKDQRKVTAYLAAVRAAGV